MPDVLISYSRKDIQFAQRVHQELEARERQPYLVIHSSIVGYKMKNIYLFVLLTILKVSLIFDGYCAKLAMVDYADQWTKVDALRQTLDKFKVEYDDYTKRIEKGELKFIPENKLFFIGSMTTNNAALHQGLDKNAGVIQKFVKNGGIVIEPTQADQNEANVDWLPDSLVCVRSDPDRAVFKIKKPNHSLFKAPNVLNEKSFQGWGHQGWPTVWEVIATQKGFDIIMESQGETAIMEAEYGKGKFVMMALAPDKYHIVGNDDNTKKQAGRFMENLLEAFLFSLPVEVSCKLTTKWASLK